MAKKKEEEKIEASEIIVIDAEVVTEVTVPGHKTRAFRGGEIQ